MGSCPDIMSFPPNTPQRQAAVDCHAQKAAAKAAKQRLKAQAQIRKNANNPKPTTTTTSPAGKGGSNDPAWKGLADLAKKGLPG